MNKKSFFHYFPALEGRLQDFAGINLRKEFI